MSYPGRGGVRRRRRSRRRRAVRRVRLASLAFLFLTTVTVTVLILSHGSRRLSATVPPAAEWSSSPSENLAILAGPSRTAWEVRKPSHPVYNYSVVPGGVHSIAELREAVFRDRAVAEHYSGFRFDQARVVTLVRPHLVYLSYRKKGAIYWTGKPHRLPAGEQVITDGKIVARTKCANRIEVRKQLGASPTEPTMAELEQMDPPPLPPPAQFQFPAEYHTALLTSPEPPGGGGTGPSPVTGLAGLPLIPPGVGGGGGGLGSGGGCETPAQEKHEHDFGQVDDESKETHCPPGNPKPPAPVPEPNTIVLMSSGLAALYYLFRKTRAPARN